jgi:hypothetical protein
MMIRSIIFILMVLISICTNAFELQTMAKQFQQVPKLPVGVTYDENFSHPTINSNGKVAFLAGLAGGDFATDEVLVLGDASTQRVVALTGTPAPGAPEGFLFCEFINVGAGNAPTPIVAENNSIGFMARVSADCNSVSGLNGLWIYSQEVDGILPVVVEGDQALGFDSGGGIAIGTIGTEFRYGNSGFLFRAELQESVTGSSLGQSYWTGSPDPDSGLQLVAWQGGSAPLLSGYSIASLNNTSGGFGVINNNKDVEFLASIINDFDSSRNWLYYIGQAGDLDILAEGGEAADEVAIGATLRAANSQNIDKDGMSINDNRDAVFTSDVALSVGNQNNPSIWRRGSVANKELIAFDGDVAPGDPLGGEFVGFGDASINKFGGVVFKANSSSNVGFTGLWKTADLGGPPVITPVIVGDQVVNLPSGEYIVKGGGARAAVINEQGEVGFVAEAVSGTGNSTGLWKKDALGIHLLALEGQDAKVPGGGTHPISNIFASGAFDLGSGNEDGKPSWFNDQGHIAIKSSQAIIISVTDVDSDGDGIADNDDNCPATSNPSQTDTDGDGIGDACDPLTDSDGDGIADSDDNCPATSNPSQADSDGDGIGDACDPLTDSDGDGIADSDDNCPSTANPGQEDKDGDGWGDVCDTEGKYGNSDSDLDGWVNRKDNCPHIYNPNQADSDGDGIGDLCDQVADSDGDSVLDNLDNCPADSNQDQSDIDGDGIGDVCDGDIDGDGLKNKRDKCPLQGFNIDRHGCPI